MQSAPESLRKQSVRAAYGLGRPKSWDEALKLLARAAEAGEPDAQREHALVTQAPIAELLTAPEADLLTDDAQIGSVPGYAPPGFCEWFIERAKDRLAPSAIYKAEGGDAVRSARDFAFDLQHRDLVLAIMQERAAYLTRVSVDFHEPPNVISYDVGEEFSLHSDFLDPRAPELRAEIERTGQRTATIVTYLNEDFEGAETWFPEVQVRYRGSAGDAIVFSNVLPDGSPDYSTVHAGLPPTKGRKWVLSQWIRNKPFACRPQDLPWPGGRELDGSLKSSTDVR